MAVITAAPTIKIDGQELAQEVSSELTNMRVSKANGSSSHTALRFNNAADVGSTFSVGAELEIGVADEGGSVTVVFSGEIVSVGIEVSAGRSELTVGAMDLSYRLGQAVVYASHMNISASGVITKMAQAAGLTPTIDASMGTSMEHIQQAATPQVFLTQLADAFGCEWFVEGTRLNVKRRESKGSPIALSGKEELRNFTARFSATERADLVEVRGWDPTTAASISAEVTPRGATSLNSSTAISNGRKAKGHAARDVVAWPRATVSADDATAIAEGLNARMEAAMLTGRGEVDVDARLTPGVLIQIDDIAPDWNGTYYVSEVEHLFGDRQPFVTRFRIGGNRPTTLVDLFGSTRANSADRLAGGVTSGTVTNIADPDGLGRVKVTLSYLPEDNETDWARVVQLGAGDGRGLQMMPEVNDEVLVAFEHGELQRPFVIGGLWNGASKAANAKAVTGDEVVERSLVNRTGDSIVMAEGDSEKDQHVSIVLDGDTALLRVGKDRVDLIAKDVPIEIKSGNASIVISDNDITLKADNITFKASKNLEMKGSTIKGAGQSAVEFKASGGLKLEGTNVDLKGSGITNVKGSMVNIN